MTVSRIGISYTAQTGANSGTEYQAILSNFADDALPRSYAAGASFSRSATGASLINGPAFRQKYVWVISVLATTEEAEAMDALFQAWDADRSQGLSAACGLVDETFGPDVVTNVVISSPPEYTRLSPRTMSVSLGLEEV